MQAPWTRRRTADVNAKNTQPLLGTRLMSLAAERANRQAIANTRAALTLLKRQRVEYEAVNRHLDQLQAARDAHLAAPGRGAP